MWGFSLENLKFYRTWDGDIKLRTLINLVMGLALIKGKPNLKVLFISFV